MQPGPLHLTVWTGQAFRQLVTWKTPVDPDADPVVYEPVDLTGYDAQATFHVAGQTIPLLHSVPTADLAITFPDDGQIELYVSSDYLADLKIGHGHWGLRMIPPGSADDVLLLTGEATIRRGVPADD